MSEQDNIKVAQADYEAFNAHDLDKMFNQLRTAEFMGEGTGAPAPVVKWWLSGRGTQ